MNAISLDSIANLILLMVPLKEVKADSQLARLVLMVSNSFGSPLIASSDFPRVWA